jgi:hypothetical protein
VTGPLPSVTLRALFTLDVSAASGLVLHDDVVTVIADDALVLKQARLDGTPLPDVPLLAGATAVTLAKAVKPDLEALVDLGDGRRLAFGSGSKPTRESAFLVDPAAGTSRIDLSALYATLRARLGTLNLEGAALDGGRLVLAQRGAGESPSALVVLEGAAAALQSGRAPDPARIDIVTLALPTLDGVPLSVTDLARHPDGTLHFLAAAERTANAIDDGPVAGSVLGCFDAAFLPRLIARLAPAVKAEGLAFWKRENGTDHWLVVTDPDDPSRRSPLYVLDLPARFV